MANLFDYLKWRGDLTFKQSPFNPVDNIIFCQLSYLPLDEIAPGPDTKTSISIGEAAEIFDAKQKANELRGFVMYKDDTNFLQTLGQTERFKNCGLFNYVNHVDIAQEKQFAAICVKFETSTYIAYRGTDVSLVGWKEDFNMSFSDAVPAQLEAVSYLKNAAKKICGHFLIGGHSKGGNLAVYAAASCAKNIRKRITAIYSNDAPGFHQHLIDSKGFAEARDRVYSYVPQSSIVGMLFEHGVENLVIKSSQAGIMQHELYSWEVSHNDLIRLDGLTQQSIFIDKTLREWINSLNYEHREQLVETLYTILTASEAQSLPEIGDDWFKASGRMIHSLKNIDSETKANVRKTITALFQAAKNNISELLPERKKKSPAD